MTPKEKAEELVLRMYQHTNDVNIIAPTQFIARQCALIAVDEIIASNIFEQNHQDYIHPFVADKNGYWREVKQEIEKL